MPEEKPMIVVEGMTPTGYFYIFTKLLTAGLCALFWYLYATKNELWIFPAILFSILVFFDIYNIGNDLRRFRGEKNEGKDTDKQGSE